MLRGVRVSQNFDQTYPSIWLFSLDAAAEDFLPVFLSKFTMLIAPVIALEDVLAGPAPPAILLRLFAYCC